MERVMAGGVALRAARPEDLPAITDLLATAGLPLQGVAEWLSRFVVAEHDGTIAGVAGLEVYGTDGLLRSVAVAEAWRGRGLGGALTAEALASARADGLRAVYLLTETAEHYFPRLGFRRIERGEVPDPVTQSVEFRELCPVSSIVMVMDVGNRDGLADNSLTGGRPRPPSA